MPTPSEPHTACTLVIRTAHALCHCKRSCSASALARGELSDVVLIYEVPGCRRVLRPIEPCRGVASCVPQDGVCARVEVHVVCDVVHLQNAYRNQLVEQQDRRSHRHVAGSQQIAGGHTTMILRPCSTRLPACSATKSTPDVRLNGPAVPGSIIRSA